MARIFSGILFALLPLIAQAAVDEAAPPPPPVDASPWGMIIFGIIFFGMIIGFIAYVWWKERERKQGSSQQS
jgi:hypothetical protein